MLGSGNNNGEQDRDLGIQESTDGDLLHALANAIGSCTESVFDFEYLLMPPRISRKSTEVAVASGVLANQWHTWLIQLVLHLGMEPSCLCFVY